MHSRRPGFLSNVRTIHPEGGAAYHPFAVFLDICPSLRARALPLPAASRWDESPAPSGKERAPIVATG